MIQFNLLPDVKIEYIRAQRIKHTVVVVSTVLAGTALGIFILLFVFVNFAQKRHMANLDKDIQSYTSKLQDIPDIDKILTVQAQLNSLTPLHEADPAASRVMEYLGKVTPAQASISQSSTDFTEGTMTINGSADSLVTVNKFVDTLKFTTYSVDGGGDKVNAFSDVVLTSFGVDDTSVTYQIDLKFDSKIFDNTLKIELQVPQITTTRSETEKPSDLFQNNSSSGTGQ